MLYSPSAEDRNITLKPTEAIYRAAVQEFGLEFFAKDTHLPKAKPMEFAVETDFDGIVVSSVTESQVLGRIPSARFDFVFVATEKLAEAKRWLNRTRIRGILGAAVESET